MYCSMLQQSILLYNSITLQRISLYSPIGNAACTIPIKSPIKGNTLNSSLKIYKKNKFDRE